MLTVVIIKNPFNLSDRDIYFPMWEKDKTIVEYCDVYSKAVAKLNSQDEIIYALNGKKVSTDVIPNDGDYIALCPIVGKKGFFGSILGAIAMIALSIFAPGWGMAAAAALGTTGVTATVVSGLITAGIMMIGGIVINKFCSVNADLSNKLSDVSTATSYTWNKTTSATNQGGALAVTYGTYLTAGTIVFRHVKVIGDEQYLILLLTGGLGPIDAIGDVKINDMPIECYSNVELQYTLGTNMQQPISLCEGKVYADQPLSYELQSDGSHEAKASDWCYALTEGNRGTGVEFLFEFPQGLYSIDDESGDLYDAWCWIIMEGREVTDEEYASGVNYRLYDDWYPLEVVKLEERRTTAFSKSYTYDGFNYGRFVVRVRCIKDAPSQYHANKLMWSQLSHIITGDFSRPGKVLLGMKIKATNQLSGNVNVTWLQARHNVLVFDIETNTYVLKPATNPAWASYDMIHCARAVTNINTGETCYVVDGIDAKYIDYYSFKAWAEQCDAFGLIFNYIFSTADDLWESLKIPEAVGLGKVVIHGTVISCIFEKYSDPVQLFTVANINENSFSIDYLPLLDRANAIEVSFINKEKNYQKDVISVYLDDYNKSTIIKNPTQLSLDGCVTLEQARRYAMYHLNQNLYLTRTCTFDVDIDSLACTLGDQILIQHDLPMWGYGGIIIDYINNNQIVIDHDIKITLSESSYQILIRLTNSGAQSSEEAEQLIYRDIINYDSDTHTVTISEPLPCIPAYGDVWAIGEIDKVAKPFTILSIERKSDLQATITCIEYEPNSINDVFVGIDKIDYSHLNSSNVNVPGVLTDVIS